MKPFEGVLSFVDTPSDRPPSGARGHRVILTRIAAESALETLVGSPLNRRYDLSGHDKDTVIGSITNAWVDRKGKLCVKGCFEEEKLGKRPSGLGMSYELKDATIDDMRSRVWKITKCTFEGAAVLKRHTAAYQTTSFTVKRRWFA